ncbi:hypothetical protein K491DRAFT_694148 [Lophiostoma macrostomum CBS 122681]|uniref:Uncharacterized protein n=1 Tax=Lophiostoma macrostomum CBS 122681 TaxID=1314788 RepID=A0A6A6T1U8_9PLEO|nr:hypothetical protein K491DRAFT_694148 [Lophiostoma macrostomum CBS 122681]
MHASQATLRINPDFGLVVHPLREIRLAATVLLFSLSVCPVRVDSAVLDLHSPLPPTVASNSIVSTVIMADASDSEPHERTTMQQNKAVQAQKQQKREAGDQTARSRSQSRRDRRRRIQKGIEDGKYMKTSSLEALEEADANNELNSMQAFERIGPDSTSMDGPVTKARAMRGEIPMRGSDPNQPYYQGGGQQGGKSKMDEQDGLKLTVEANLEIEIELKASIRGDLTLSLLE